MKVLITGGKGLIGKIISEGLRDKFEIESYDLVDGKDILDTDNLKNCLSDKDACIHLAGIPAPSGIAWERYKKSNVDGTLSVVKACKAAGIKKVIYLSSGAVYGWQNLDLKNLPLTEDAPLPVTWKIVDGETTEDCSSFRSIVKYDGKEFFLTYADASLDDYDISKIFCEKIIEDYFDGTDVSSIVLRLDTPVPPAPIRADHLFATITHDNLSEAFRAALESNIQGFDVFNIGDPSLHPLALERFDIKEWVENNCPSVLDNWQPNLPLYSIDKAKKVLGYDPEEPKIKSESDRHHAGWVPDNE